MLLPLGQTQNIINIFNKFKEQKEMLRLVTFFIITIHNDREKDIIDGFKSRL
jgi:hypothetical protein